jgi:hypothetical protein
MGYQFRERVGHKTLRIRLALSGLRERNMRPAIFVQNNLVERLTAPVARFARAEGIALEDRSSTSEFDVDNCGIDWTEYHPVLLYGSVQLIRELKKSKSLARYVLHDDHLFSARHWQQALGAAMLNEHGRLVTANEVFGLLADAPMHVRPDAEDKAFVAAVFDVSSWGKVTADRKVAPELRCWISPVRRIYAEWRCWVIGGVVEEASQYRRDGVGARERGAPVEVRNFANRVVQDFTPAPCVVVDIALTDDGYRVVELNAIHCSGWYTADSSNVLRKWLAWTCAHC